MCISIKGVSSTKWITKTMLRNYVWIFGNYGYCLSHSLFLQPGVSTAPPWFIHRHQLMLRHSRRTLKSLKKKFFQRGKTRLEINYTILNQTDFIPILVSDACPRFPWLSTLSPFSQVLKYAGFFKADSFMSF